MQVVRRKVWIHRHELIDSLVVHEKSKIKFYCHTYMVDERGRGWRPYVRWDNWERQPHVDKFDANGALIEQRACNEKKLEEIIKLVKIFRKNLLTMDITQL